MKLSPVKRTVEPSYPSRRQRLRLFDVRRAAVAAGASALFWIAGCSVGETAEPEVTLEPTPDTAAVVENQDGADPTVDSAPPPDVPDPLLDGSNLNLPLGTNLESEPAGQIASPAQPPPAPAHPTQPVAPVKPPPQPPVVVSPDPPKPPEHPPIRLAGRRPPPRLR